MIVVAIGIFVLACGLLLAVDRWLDESAWHLDDGEPDYFPFFKGGQ